MSRATENKETQTVHTVDASVQTEKEKTVSTDKLTTLMVDALANVPGTITQYTTKLITDAKICLPSVLRLKVKFVGFLDVDFFNITIVFCFLRLC